MQGDHGNALNALFVVIDNGFGQAKLFRTDDNLNSLRSVPRFKELLQRLKQLNHYAIAQRKDRPCLDRKITMPDDSETQPAEFQQPKTNSDTKKPKKPKRLLRRLLYGLLFLILLGAVGVFGAVEYAKYRLFQDTPNRLAFEGDLHSVPFEWSAHEMESYSEPHGAILIPVSVPGIANKFYMQFDTGSPDTWLRTGSLKSLKNHGVEFELFEKEKHTYVKQFELNVAGNRVLMKSGVTRTRDIAIDWDNPDAKNVIGSFGADFLDQKICEIDFPAQEIRLHHNRPESLNELGSFTPFKFKGRRIMLPASIDGSDVELFYDSGCSAFGLLTSKYHYDRLTDPNEKEIAYGANRHGDSVPIHHKSSDRSISLGATELPLKRVSYAELYNFLQTTVGRVIGGGFFGNKSLTESTLIIDAVTNEFLVVKQPAQPPQE